MRLKSLFIASVATALGLQYSHGQGYWVNSNDLRSVLLVPSNNWLNTSDPIISEIRIFIDIIPENVNGSPWYYNNQNQVEFLSRKEIEEAVKLAMGNWASVIQGLGFRIVDSDAQAHLVIRFRNYGFHISGKATAEAFYPSAWNASPDFSCGKVSFGIDDHGGTCDERDENIILAQTDQFSSRGSLKRSSKEIFEWSNYLGDRTRTSTTYFENAANTCVSGQAVGGVLPVLSIAPPPDGGCVPWTDRMAFPHSGEMGMIGTSSLAYVIQHEVGHTLLGDHTSTDLGGGTWEVHSRNPVFDQNHFIARGTVAATSSLAGVTGGSRSFSVLADGNPSNMPGIFNLDADRLASGWPGATTSDWNGYDNAGYPITYPQTRWYIKMENQTTGEVRYTRNWHEAHALMGWPNITGTNQHAIHDTQWFQVGIVSPGEMGGMLNSSIYSVLFP